MDAIAPLLLLQLAEKLIFFLVWMAIGIPCGLVVLWAIWDSWEYTGYGLAWTFAFIICPPLAVPYLIASLYARRSVSAARAEREEAERELHQRFKFESELDRAKFVEASMGGHGTLYDPSGLGHGVGGSQRAPRAHFTDEHAEELLAARDYAAAQEYLQDLLALALDNDDPNRAETYRHYLSRLPGALAPPKPERAEQDEAERSRAEREQRRAERKSSAPSPAPAERSLPF